MCLICVWFFLSFSCNRVIWGNSQHENDTGLCLNYIHVINIFTKIVFGSSCWYANKYCSQISINSHSQSWIWMTLPLTKSQFEIRFLSTITGHVTTFPASGRIRYMCGVVCHCWDHSDMTWGKIYMVWLTHCDSATNREVIRFMMLPFMHVRII